MSELTLAATQMACTWDRDANVEQAQAMVREAAAAGAQLVLLQELFETPYFCKDERNRHFALARPAAGHPMIGRMRTLAAELSVVLPVSFFERAGNAYFNTVAVIDADGEVLGYYRKSHIPHGRGYQEKFYFSPGDTGFRVFETRYAKIGVGVCWDQWFPEAARAMTLLGAQVLLYPTAIGREPAYPDDDSSDHWQRTMQGHAAANLIPLVASNRVGVEEGESVTLDFYGRSFIADHYGAIVTEANRTDRTVLTATVDLEASRLRRTSWGIFRDRRPELYQPILSMDASG